MSVKLRFGILVFLLLSLRPLYASLEPGQVPEHVKVMPVFFVPSDEKEPSRDQKARLVRHLRIAQSRFREMLKRRDTFQIENKQPLVIKGMHPISYYKLEDRPWKMNYEPLSEIFTACSWNRFNCPYVLVIIIMNSKENCPTGGGRPFNTGFNGGGGFIYMSSYLLDKYPAFQATLQHELGHSFGLVHITAYGYDKEKNPSIMSSNNNNYWNGFEPPESPGILIPEDLRSLARNKKVFLNFYFDPAVDIPPGYKINRTTVRLVPVLKLFNQKEYKIKVTTDSGQAHGSSVSHLVHNIIVLNKERKDGSGYNPRNMWHSDITETGWVNVELTFPVPVSLCKVAVHSQHSGKFHMAHEVRIQAKQNAGFMDVCQEPLTSADAYVSFPKCTADQWRFSFRPGQSKQVVIRGLRFFSSETNEIFCQNIPPIATRPTTR